MDNCYYFGTFNPPHRGHLAIAEAVKRVCGFKKVIFVPAFCPSHKSSDLASPEDRLNMLKLAAGAENVSDIEYHLKTPSYTYQTIERLGKCCFIIGYDAFFEIESWARPEYLKKMLNFIVIPRRPMPPDFQERLCDLSSKDFEFNLLNVDFIDISSENIRKCIKNNLPISEFVPEEVEEYIYGNKLYGNN